MWYNIIVIAMNISDGAFYFCKKVKGKYVEIIHELVTVTAEFGAFYVTEKSGRLALNDDA